MLEEQVAVVELLVAAGADVNKGNPLHSNWAPIHWAALTDNTQVQGGNYLMLSKIFDVFKIFGALKNIWCIQKYFML